MTPKSNPDMVEKYGLRWDLKKIGHPAIVELAMYSNEKLRQAAGSKALDRADHMRNAIRTVLPEHVFSFNRWSNWIIDSWCDRTIITIWGSSSSGKSGTVGGVLLFDLLAAPGSTQTNLITSPMREHDRRCWGSVKKWYAHLPDELRIGRIVKAPNPGLLTVDREGQSAGINCISTDQGEAEEDLKSKIGAHQKRNRLAVDEPQKCSASILSIKANFGASGELKEIFLGNPDSWHSPLGLHSVPHCLLDGTPINQEYVEREEPKTWETKNTWNRQRGILIVLDGRDSPGIEDPSLDFLPDRNHIPNLEANYGRDSMQVYTYGIGRMPPGGVDNTLISMPDFRANGCMEPPKHLHGNVITFAGLDPSGGRDGVRLARVQVGLDENGYTILQILNIHTITVALTRGDISGQIATETVQKLREWGLSIRDFAADATGNQSAQVDRIEQTMGQRGAHRVFFSGPATNRKVSASGTTAQEIYNDHASEMMSGIANLCHQARLRGANDAFAHQITTRRTLFQNGRTKVETKDDWRDRNDGGSPDDMDAVLCALELAIERSAIRTWVDVTAPQKPDPRTDTWLFHDSNRHGQSSYVERLRRVSNTINRGRRRGRR